MKTRILLVGEGLFQEGLSHFLAGQTSLKIIGGVGSWQEVQSLFAQESPHIIIVDHASAQLREVDLAPFLDSNLENLKVIYLTLSDNKMIVHNREEITNATPADLLNALQGISQ